MSDFLIKIGDFLIKIVGRFLPKSPVPKNQVEKFAKEIINSYHMMLEMNITPLSDLKDKIIGTPIEKWPEWYDFCNELEKWYFDTVSGIPFTKRNKFPTCESRDVLLRRLRQKRWWYR